MFDAEEVSTHTQQFLESPASARPRKGKPPKPHQPKPSIPLEIFKPRSPGQVQLQEALDTKRLILVDGAAGSGKTLLSIQKAIRMLVDGKVSKIVLSRPAVNAGETLGYLPGDIAEKMDPYLRPLFDAALDVLGGPSEEATRTLRTWRSHGQLEICPIAFLRGRTLKHAYFVLDEAQNATYAQLKMVLTRIGKGSYMVLNGDTSQSDLPPKVSGFQAICDKLRRRSVYPVLTLQAADVQRDPIVTELLGLL
jgi:phosphate starvation-inducible PhoH-like protein